MLLHSSLTVDVAELYARYHRLIFTYLFRLSGSDQVAQDLVQETFYRAIRSIASYRGDPSPASWLCRIGRNLYLNEIKRLGRHQGQIAEAAWDLIPDPAAGPEAEALRLDQRKQIQAVLAELPEIQRMALLLRDTDGLDYESIAALLGLSLANVKVTIHRARIRFRAAYRQKEESTVCDRTAR